MTLEALYCLAAPLILLQALALGWTVDRQIRTPVAQRQGVIAPPDVLNTVSLFAVVAFVILMPLVSGSHLLLARAVLGGGAYVLLCFHPLDFGGLELPGEREISKLHCVNPLRSLSWTVQHV